MPETKVVAPGFFCWCELGVRDTAAAKKFYGTLLGWEIEDVAVGDQGSYGMIQLGGRSLGGLYELMPEAQGQPQWSAYVKVESVDKTVRKAAELGGRVVMEPMDVMNHGRMAVLQDPTGAMLSLWEPKDNAGFEVMGETNGPVWFELVSKDKAEGIAFYAALFGWKLETFLGSMDYTLFKSNDQSVGGAMQITPQMGDCPSHWLIYYAVPDCDKAVARVKELGGGLVAGPMDIPEVGRFAIVGDPEGAVFAVIRPMPPGDV